jgi:hypothetical protein
VTSIEKTKDESDRAVLQEHCSQPSAPDQGTRKDIEREDEDNDVGVVKDCLGKLFK